MTEIANKKNPIYRQRSNWQSSDPVASFRLNEKRDITMMQKKVCDSVTELSPASSIHLATLLSRPMQRETRPSRITGRYFILHRDIHVRNCALYSPDATGLSVRRARYLLVGIIQAETRNDRNSVAERKIAKFCSTAFRSAAISSLRYQTISLVSNQSWN